MISLSGRGKDMKIRFAFLLVMVGFVATVSSCNNRSLNALNPCTINGVVQNVPVNPQRALDLLILIDDSPSMEQEQAKLAEQVPRLVNLLLTGGVDTDGSTPLPGGEFPAVESLHVGIITPDLGWSTEPQTNYSPPDDFNPTPACEVNNGLGKAGFMQTSGLIDDDNNATTPRVSCDAQTPPEGTLYLNYPESDFTPDDLVNDVKCVTGQTDGCGFEQQLEAILASNRNTANGGFNREDALLAVILITDEDDCSTTDPRVFDVEQHNDNPYQGPWVDPDTKTEVQFNLRCWAHSEALQGIERYVTGIAGLKADPSQVVFAAITGIPEQVDCADCTTEADRYQAILNDADMEEVPDPATEGMQNQQLRPACTASDGSGSAAPARRIVEVAADLAGDTQVGTVVESICAADYAPALNAIVDRIAAALRQLCLPRPLNRNASGLVGCEVREVQPEGQNCATAGRGREPEPVATEDGREVCRVTQLSSAAGPPDGLGWYYDDFAGAQEACSFNPEQQRVSFTEGAAPMAGARIRFECLQAAPPQDVDIGWPCSIDAECDPNPDDCLEGETAAQCETRILQERYGRDNLELICDLSSNTCQLTCESNVQCPGGFACYDEDEDGTSYCVNPTCSLN
jgi:hypothetical protein